jgi:hypothetical protein
VSRQVLLPLGHLRLCRFDQVVEQFRDVRNEDFGLPRAGDERVLDHVQERQPRTELVGECCGISDRLLRMRAEVHGDQNPVE